MMLQAIARGSALEKLQDAGHGWLLYRAPDAWSRLPSESETAALAADVEAALEPINLDKLQPLLGRLIASWPQRPPDDPRGYVMALVEHLAPYPPAVLRQTAHEAVRSFRFVPSVAELVEIADRLVRPLQILRRHLALVEVERERRQQEAAAQAERDRQAQERRRREDLVVERLGELLGDPAAAERRWRRLDFSLRWDVLKAGDGGDEKLEEALRALPMVAAGDGDGRSP